MLLEAPAVLAEVHVPGLGKLVSPVLAFFGSQLWRFGVAADDAVVYGFVIVARFAQVILVSGVLFAVAGVVVRMIIFFGGAWVLVVLVLFV